MATPALLDLDLEISDLSGQKRLNVKSVAEDATVGELIEGTVPRMRLPQEDVEGRALNYHALLDREGRHLHASERVGEVLQPKDRIVLQPNIDAGQARC
jgi:hypothetical protein